MGDGGPRLAGVVRGPPRGDARIKRGEFRIARENNPRAAEQWTRLHFCRLVPPLERAKFVRVGNERKKENRIQGPMRKCRKSCASFDIHIYSINSNKCLVLYKKI